MLRSAALALLLILSAPQAHALGLDALAGGGSIASGNGVLNFSDFDVVATGSVRSDLSLYDVQALVDGIAITGPIAAADGRAGDLFIQFTVSSNAAITGAQLRFNGAASGSGSSASVTETFGDVDGQLFVFSTGGGGRALTASLGLDGLTSLRVSKDILVDSAATGHIAVISRIEQRFQTGEPVPEPTALLLIGAGLAGLALRRR